jgi:hypothetical protein
LLELFFVLWLLEYLQGLHQHRKGRGGREEGGKEGRRQWKGGEGMQVGEIGGMTEG